MPRPSTYNASITFRLQRHTVDKIRKMRHIPNAQVQQFLDKLLKTESIENIEELQEKKESYEKQKRKFIGLKQRLGIENQILEDMREELEKNGLKVKPLG